MTYKERIGTFCLLTMAKTLFFVNSYNANKVSFWQFPFLSLTRKMKWTFPLCFWNECVFKPEMVFKEVCSFIVFLSTCVSVKNSRRKSILSLKDARFCFSSGNVRVRWMLSLLLKFCIQVWLWGQFCLCSVSAGFYSLCMGRAAVRVRHESRLRGECRVTVGWVVNLMYFPPSSRLALVLPVKCCTALTVLSTAFMFWRLLLFVIDTSQDRLWAILE